MASWRYSEARTDPASGEPLADVLREAASDLFAVGLQVHLALRFVDRDTEAAQRLHSVLTRLDKTITMLHQASRDRSTAQALEQTMIDEALIARAQGILAERHRIPIADAVTALAAYAHQQHQHLPDVARAVIDATIDLSESIPPGRSDADDQQPI